MESEALFQLFKSTFAKKYSPEFRNDPEKEKLQKTKN